MDMSPDNSVRLAGRLGLAVCGLLKKKRTCTLTQRNDLKSVDIYVNKYGDHTYVYALHKVHVPTELNFLYFACRCILTSHWQNELPGQVPKLLPLWSHKCMESGVLIGRGTISLYRML